VTDRTPAGLTALYWKARRADEAAAEVKSETGKALEAVEQLLWNSFEDAHLRECKLDDGDGVRLQQKPYAVVRDHGALREWAMANGFENKLALPWGTINSEVSERLLNGLELPAGVEVYVKTTTYKA